MCLQLRDCSFLGPSFLAQTRQSLWIYTTVIVENMQTVCEGLHVTCKRASGHSDSTGCSLFANELSLNPNQGSVSTRLCVCFLTLILPISNTSKSIKKHLYIIYININMSIYCISFFVKAVLSYKCMDAMHHGLLNKM